MTFSSGLLTQENSMQFWRNLVRSLHKAAALGTCYYLTTAPRAGVGLLLVREQGAGRAAFVFLFK